jgi:hypothetical protein
MLNSALVLETAPELERCSVNNAPECADRETIMRGFTPALAVALALVVSLEHPLRRVTPHEAISASSDEIVAENCYIAREPVVDKAGRTRVQVEVLCD